MSTNNKPLTVFLDNIGRTIIGKLLSKDDTSFVVENPALVHIQPNSQTNQLQLQLLPLFFKEFQADKSAPTIWNYRTSNITVSEDIAFAPQFAAQYEQLFQVAPPAQPTKVVKLFDDE